MLWMLSASCLSVIVTACVGAALQELRYRGSYNLAQLIGTTFLFFGCFPRLRGIVETQSMAATAAVAEASILIHVGLAIMALGHAWKLWQYRGQQRSTPRRLSQVLLHLHRGKPS